MPKTFVACAPTPAAPIVFAIVFNVRMADNGRSILLFNLNSLSAEIVYLVSWDFISAHDSEADSITASIIEQQNDIINAIKAKIISSNIYVCIFYLI